MAIPMCQDRYNITRDIHTSLCRGQNMNSSTPRLTLPPAVTKSLRSFTGRLSTDEINAAWNETSLWFAITHPRSKYPAALAALIFIISVITCYSLLLLIFVTDSTTYLIARYCIERSKIEILLCCAKQALYFIPMSSIGSPLLSIYGGLSHIFYSLNEK